MVRSIVRGIFRRYDMAGINLKERIIDESND